MVGIIKLYEKCFSYHNVLGKLNNIYFNKVSLHIYVHLYILIRDATVLQKTFSIGFMTGNKYVEKNIRQVLEDNNKKSDRINLSKILQQIFYLSASIRAKSFIKLWIICYIRYRLKF